MIKKIKNLLAYSIEQEKKSPFSVRLYNIVALLLLTVTCSLLSISWVLFLRDNSSAPDFWLLSSYFVVVLFYLGFVIGIKQRLRGSFLLSKICSCLMILCVAAFIALIIWMRLSLGEIDIFMFP